MKRMITAILIFVCAASFGAAAAQFVSQDDFRKWNDEGRKMIIVDIQSKDEFEKHHFKGSRETNAYPAKTDDEKKHLDGVLPTIRSSEEPVVIVCPKGRSGAQNTHEYLKSKGVSENRLYILEGGIAGCPDKDRLKSGR